VPVFTGCSCLYREFSKPLLPVGRAGVLLSEILHLLCRQMVSANSVRPFDHVVGRAVTAVSLGSVNSSRLGVQVFPFLFDRERRVWPLLDLASVRGTSALLLPTTLGRITQSQLEGKLRSKQSQATCYLCLVLEQN
jgi:hypothetical protein